MADATNTPITDCIDLNADLGESFGQWQLGDDAGMLELVTSANVACGFHAGDPATLLATCEQAVRGGVTIGAQVGYRDLAGFGRRFIDVTAEDLTADVLYQLSALDGLARSCGGRVAYLKPHGALYNTIVHHEAQAAAVVAAVKRWPGDPLPVLGLPGSVFLAQAEAAGLPVVREAFADRAYTPQGTLVSRREPDAVLHDPADIARRVVRLVTTGELTARDGSTLSMQADSVCLHGDTPGAVEMARQVRAALGEAGVTVRPFAS
ncbi:LamB/YcsF family protein [Calidifontibacter terrae]